MAMEVGNIHIGLYVDVGQTGRFNDVASVVERSSRRMNTALGNTTNSVRSLRGQMSQSMRFNIAANSLRDLTKATDEVGRLRAAILGLTALSGAGVTGAFTAAYLVQTADKAKLLGNQLRTVTTDFANMGAIQDKLFDISQRTRSGLEATTRIYARAARAGAAFGLSQEKVLTITETVQKAFAVGGATPQEASSAALQLSQGIASDRFGGDEYKSVSESAPVLRDSIAKALKVDIGTLRKMSEEGKLTAKVVTQAILDSADEINAAYAVMAPTVAQSFTLLDNAFLRYVGTTDEAYGLTEKLSAAIMGLADNFENVMYWTQRVAGGLLAVYAARKLVTGVQGKVSSERSVSAGVQDQISNIVDENTSISKRLVEIDKERVTVATEVASANAKIVSSLQRQVDVAKEVVRTNSLRVIQATPGSKGEVAAMERYSRSVDDLQRKTDLLAKTPLVTDETVKVRERLNVLDGEASNLIDRQVTNTQRLAAAHKRLTVVRRMGSGVLDYFGGGVGLGITLALTAATTAAAYFAAEGAKAAQQSAALRDEMFKLGLVSAETAGQVDLTSASLDNLTDDKRRQKIFEIRKEMERLKGSTGFWEGLFSEDDLGTLGDLSDALDDLISQKTTRGRSQNTSDLPIVRDLKGLVDEAINAKRPIEEIVAELDEIAKKPLSEGMNEMVVKARALFDTLKGTAEYVEKINKSSTTPSGIDMLNRYATSRTDAAENLQNIDSAKEVVVTTLIDEANMNDAEKRIKAIMEEIVKGMEKAGQTINTAAVRTDAERIYANEQTTGAVSGFTERVIKNESGGKSDARPLNADGSRRSSAYGPGQFLESTWLNLFKKYFPERTAAMLEKYGKDAVNGQILALRSNSADSKTLIEAYARENAGILQKAGVSVDEVALQLAHFLGPQGAVKVLTAAPGTAVSGLLSPDAIKANPEVLGGGATVDSVIAYGQKRAGMNTAGTAKLDSKEAFNNALGEQQRLIDGLLAEAGIRQSLNPLVNDYGRALSTLEAAQKLLNTAQEEGTAAGLELKNVQQLLKGDFTSLTPEARAQAEAMLSLAQKTGEVTASGARLEESQERLKSRLQESSSLGKDVFGGIISDLREGASAGDILSNVFDKLLDKMIEMSLTNMFDGAIAGSGGGALGGLFAPLLSLFGFDDGGWTGPGGKKKPAGVVHADEFVFTKKATRKAGVSNLYALMDYLETGKMGSLVANDNMPGYEMGGYVGTASLPSLPSHRQQDSGVWEASGGRQAMSQPRDMHITLGWSKGANGDIAPIIESVSETKAQEAVQKAAPSIVSAANQQVVPTVAKHQANKAGGDWRS